MFLGNVLVGFPLAKLSLSIASFIPFVVAALAIALSFVVISGRKTYKRTEAIVFIFIIICAWWGYLWLPYSLHMVVDDLGLLAVGLTHWQTINGTYVVQTCVLLTLSAVIARTLSPYPRWAFVLTVISALNAGFGGPALALSSVIMASLIALIHLRKRKQGTTRIMLLAVFIVICTVAALASLKLSPGSMYRSSLINNHVSLPLQSIPDLLVFTTVYPLEMWLLTFVNIGAISSGLIVLAASILIRKRRSDALRNSNYLMWSGYLCSFSFVQCVVNRLCEYFTYTGYWHYASAQLCSFLSIMLFSVWLMESILPKLAQHKANVLLLTLTIIAFAGNAFALQKMVQSMSDRQKVWQVGAAPLPGVQDIEDNTGWQMGCWKSLETARQRIDPPGFRLSADK